MTKNPLLNALAALAYISAVASMMFYGQRIAPEGPDIVLMPIAMLSLLSLSAAVMGYVFLLKPIELYFEGNKKAGATLLLKTIACFAAITGVLFAAMVSGIFS